MQVAEKPNEKLGSSLVAPFIVLKGHIYSVPAAVVIPANIACRDSLARGLSFELPEAHLGQEAQAYLRIIQIYSLGVTVKRVNLGSPQACNFPI